MLKFIVKYAYKIISFLFAIGVVLVGFVRGNLENSFYCMMIDYYFWFIFGLFVGFSLVRKLDKKYYEIIQKEKQKEIEDKI